MNRGAQQLGLKKSNFASAHGMYHEFNHSCAYDMARLCHNIMKDQLFKEIVKVQHRECASQKYSGHIYRWKNTNHLLKYDPNCTGIKTGVTWAAGPCLAASVRREGSNICVIILSCASAESRWVEVPKLVNWGLAKLLKINTSKLRPKMKKKIIKNFTYI